MDLLHNDIDIRDFLPHREPMLMVHRLISIDKESVSCSFKVDEECIFVSQGVLSETGLIEHAAQTSTAIVGQRLFPSGVKLNTDTRVIGYISAIKNVQLGLSPRNGEELITHSSLVSHVDSGPVSICVTECVSHVNDRQVLSCRMNFLIQEIPE